MQPGSATEPSARGGRPEQRTGAHKEEGEEEEEELVEEPELAAPSHRVGSASWNRCQLQAGTGPTGCPAQGEMRQHAGAGL